MWKKGIKDSYMLIYSLYTCKVYSLQVMFYLYNFRYDKRDDFNFPPANFLFLRGNMQSSSDDGVFLHISNVIEGMLFWWLYCFESSSTKIRRKNVIRHMTSSLGNWVVDTDIWC